jgi:hypothetical protein
MMQFYWMLLGTLAVWRVTHFLHAEDGPADVALRLRTSAGAGFWGRLLGCFYCLSLWSSVPFAVVIGSGVIEILLLWLALSAGAILLERLTQVGPAPAVTIEQGEDSDELLRTKSHD